jgi:phosphomannomutase
MIEKVFKAYDVRAVYPQPLNEDVARKVGFATATFLKENRSKYPPVKHPNTMVVGQDMRPSSPSLAGALIEGIRAAGIDVIDVGMIDTSFIYFAINHADCLGGIQTTASHNPIQYNGFKISGPQAKPIGSASGLDDIKKLAAALTTIPSPTGKLEHQDWWAPYRAHVLQFLNLKRKLKVIADGSNGMAGKMVPAVFGNIPNLEIVPILFEITGSFTHDPNPLVEENLHALRTQMKKTPGDLGACFDGDADRCIFLDETGKTVGCDILTALLAKDFLVRPENKGAAIVYDLRSSHVVKDEVLAAGGVPKRDRVGHAFIKKTLAETKAVFGGELSGHFYFRDNFYADSGAIAFACLLSVLSAQPKPLSGIISPLLKYAQTGEVNFQVEDKDGTITRLAETYKSAQIDYLDGITVDCGDWWFNVRKSNTEPLLRLNLEAKTPAMCTEKFTELKKILGEPAVGH